MVFLVLNGLRYPGPDGKERHAEPNDVVHYLPAESIPWLLEQGQVRALCASISSGVDCACDWCQLAALTHEDRKWLESNGWEDPFSD